MIKNPSGQFNENAARILYIVSRTFQHLNEIGFFKFFFGRNESGWGILTKKKQLIWCVHTVSRCRKLLFRRTHVLKHEFVVRI